jgi:hypothetical protein
MPIFPDNARDERGRERYAMSVSTGKGRTKELRYCGSDYVVRPGDAVRAHANQAAWEISCDGRVIHPHVLSIPHVVGKIHEHAVGTGSFPSRLDDGIGYEPMLAKLKRGN